MNKYPIIHLATHAVSSVDKRTESFIAFYPQEGTRTEDRLFLEELYGLNMNATRLVIISACETGQGELVSNEGRDQPGAGLRLCGMREHDLQPVAGGR